MGTRLEEEQTLIKQVSEIVEILNVGRALTDNSQYTIYVRRESYRNYCSIEISFKIASQPQYITNRTVAKVSCNFNDKFDVSLIRVGDLKQDEGLKKLHKNHDMRWVALNENMVVAFDRTLEEVREILTNYDNYLI